MFSYIWIIKSTLHKLGREIWKDIFSFRVQKLHYHDILIFQYPISEPCNLLFIAYEKDSAKPKNVQWRHQYPACLCSFLLLLSFGYSIHINSHQFKSLFEVTNPWFGIICALVFFSVLNSCFFFLSFSATGSLKMIIGRGRDRVQNLTARF